jgi:hypothetical protein
MGIISKYIKQIIYPLLIIGGILSSYGQTFTHSGYIYGSNAVGIQGVQVYLYSRTTPAMTGFTSQQNYNGHSYYRSTGTMTWTAARQACLNMGGHLVTVTTAAENNFIYNLWPSGWIGLTDEVVEGQWRWVTGETYSYQSWNSGEPNNSNNEDYIQFVGGGRWNDLNNNSSLPYVLEFEYIVEYTPWTLVTTVTTDATGRYSFSNATNPSIEYYITFTPPALTIPVLLDGTLTNNIVIGNTNIKSVDYFRYDVNGDSRFTVSDVYSILARKSGLFSSFTPTPVSRIFNSTQWSTINLSTANLKVSYPGLQSVTINSPTSGGVSNYYITRLGNTN